MKEGAGNKHACSVQTNDAFTREDWRSLTHTCQSPLISMNAGEAGLSLSMQDYVRKLAQEQAAAEAAAAAAAPAAASAS